MAFAQLIPGLPNDLAIQCLLCLSAKDLLRAQQVSSLWRIAITSDRFHVERRLRTSDPSICVIRRTRNSYQILESLDKDEAHLANSRLLFSCDLQGGLRLFPAGVVFAAVGGSVLAFAPGTQVQKFNLLTRNWIAVNKIVPPQCKLFATTLGNLVVLVACQHFDDDANVDDGNVAQRHGHNVHDGVVQHTMCEVFDSENNQWASLEGLPDAFAGTHCVTFQGVVYVRGKTNNLPQISVYALDLSKRRWKEDVHMTDRMQSVLPKSKVIIKPDAILMASQNSNECLSFQHQRAGAFGWMDVVKLNVRPPGDFFVFEHGDEIFLAASDAGQNWRCRPIFYYQGLTILRIPSDELLMVDSIGRKMSSKM